MMQTSRWMLPVLALALPLLCRAIPTGLNVMPTAETLGIATARVDYESSGSGKLYVPSGATIYGTQFGMILGIEGGMDRVTDRGTVYNFKFRFFPDTLVIPAMAIGAQNIVNGQKPQYYLVTTKSLLLAKVSAGVMRTEGNTLSMLGASAGMGPFILKADRIMTGGHQRTSGSIGFSLKGITFTGTAYDIKDAPNERTLTVSYMQNAF